MPQMGQLPGPIWRTCGCIGQVYSTWLGSPLATGFAAAGACAWWRGHGAHAQRAHGEHLPSPCRRASRAGRDDRVDGARGSFRCCVAWRAPVPMCAVSTFPRPRLMRRGQHLGSANVTRSEEASNDPPDSHFTGGARARRLCVFVAGRRLRHRRATHQGTHWTDALLPAHGRTVRLGQGTRRRAAEAAADCRQRRRSGVAEQPRPAGELCRPGHRRVRPRARRPTRQPLVQLRPPQRQRRGGNRPRLAVRCAGPAHHAAGQAGRAASLRTGSAAGRLGDRRIGRRGAPGLLRRRDRAGNWSVTSAR